MDGSLRGQLDLVDRHELRGWAQNPDRPDQPVSLLLTLNGSFIGRVIANRFRQDLADAAIGTGRHGFALAFHTGLSPLSHHHVRVTRELDGIDLPGSPWLLEPATTLDEPSMTRLAGLLDDGIDTDAPELDRRLDFLLHQLDRLLARRARQGPATGEASAIPGWHALRQRDRAGGEYPSASAASSPQALVIDELMPDPDRDAGSCAVLSHMLSLRRLGYTVRFVAAAGGDTAPAAARLQAYGIETCRPPFYASVEEVLRRHAGGLDLVYLHRGSIAFRYARLVRHHCPQARLVYAVADLQHVRLARQAQAQGRAELLPQARQIRHQELEAAATVDAILTHSTHEAELLRTVLPRAALHVVSWSVVPRPVEVPFGQRAGVAFLADYAHAPNLDAAQRLVREIMPLVWEHEPAMLCLLAGSRLPTGFDADPRIVAVGHVPRLASLFVRIRLTVAPLAFGAGIKGKVMESLAAGIPCVCTPVAAEGMELPSTLLDRVRGDTHGLAAEILALHRDEPLNRTIARAGLDWTALHLSEQRLDQAMGAVAGRAAGAASDLRGAMSAG